MTKRFCIKHDLGAKSGWVQFKQEQLRCHTLKQIKRLARTIQEGVGKSRSKSVCKYSEKVTFLPVSLTVGPKAPQCASGRGKMPRKKHSILTQSAERKIRAENEPLSVALPCSVFYARLVSRHPLVRCAARMTSRSLKIAGPWFVVP